MSKTLIIVESPAKANKIQELLGKEYIVMASVGHITELAKGGNFGIGIDIENDFKPRYILMKDKVEVLDKLLAAAKKCDNILLGGDNDREGTAICWHLQQRLLDTDKPMKRMIFNKIKKDALLKGIKEAADIDMRIVHSQEARRILDRIVGFMASPFLMNFFGPKLSAGRVQSVVSRMVIDREQEIDVFIPEVFWTIQVALTKDKKEGFQTKYSGRPIDLKTAEAMKNKLAAQNAQFVVSEVVADVENKSAPAPLITSTLQRIMSKEYGMGADRTMKAAQSLYEQGYISYIRTDSVRVGEEEITAVRKLLEDKKLPIPKKPNIFKNKDQSQDAHECLHPTELELLPEDNFAIIDPDEKAVYEIVWKYFVASQMMPATYQTLKMTAHIQGDKTAEVKASGKALSSKGYLEMLGGDDNSKIEIPMLKVGDILSHFGKYPVKMEKKETQPPPRYSEDKLLKELEAKNIGRPATYADLLSKITSRNYVEKKGNVYHATPLGKKITNELTKFFTFMDYNYTAKLEKQLDEIESGKLDHIEMLKKFYPDFKLELDQAYLGHGGCLCEKCGSPMATRKTKTGTTFMGCSAWPKCNSTKNIDIVQQVA